MDTKECSLVFLRRDDEILLAMKKRGFGAGRYNGVGGKLDPGESVEQTMIRECEEEIVVTPTEYEKVAYHDFVGEDEEGNKWRMLVHAFVATAWQGDPVETEEMAPEWFKLSNIPYDSMWSDDRYWLPQVLAGKYVMGRFTFNKDDEMLDKQVEVVEHLES